MTPELAGLIEYATTGSEQTLQALAKATEKDQPERAVAKRRDLLDALRPIPRGTPAEVQLVETALVAPQPDVQRAALALAVAGAQRSDAYQTTLVARLTDD